MEKGGGMAANGTILEEALFVKFTSGHEDHAQSVRDMLNKCREMGNGATCESAYKVFTCHHQEMHAMHQQDMQQNMRGGTQ